MKKLNVGIVGTGSLSNLHINAYKNNPNVNVIAVCDINAERARQKAAEFCIDKVYENYNEMLLKSNVDAVSVITSNNTHAEISIAALEAGKHVLCEKPPATTLADALKMEEASRKSGKLLMFGMVRRFAQNTSVLKEYVTGGALGEIYYAKTGFLRRCGNPGGWFSQKSISGGGPLIDIGIHIIDLAIYLMGSPEPVEIFGNTCSRLGNRANIKGVEWYKAADFHTGKNEVEDFANALIKFENGSSLFIETSWAMNLKKDELYMDFYGDKGGAKLEPTFEIYGEQNNYMVDIKPVLDSYSFDAGKSFQSEIDHFTDCIMNGKKCICPAEDGVKIMKIIDAIYKSSENGGAVKLK